MESGPEHHREISSQVTFGWEDIALNFCVVLIGCGIGFGLLLRHHHSHEVTRFGNDTIESMDAPRRQTKIVGDALIEIGYFRGERDYAVFEGGRDGGKISVTLPQGECDDVAEIARYQGLANSLAKARISNPMTVELREMGFETRRTLVSE